jgi:hypothetical protein
MTVTLKRKLNAEEEVHVLKTHGRNCFATGHPIPDGEVVHYDHIQAFSLDGVSELDNIAPMCQDHNLQKGTLSLSDFRVKLQMGEFFALGDRLTVGNLLRYLKERGDISDFGKAVTVSEQGDSVQVESSIGKSAYRLYECPLTKWKYFYATLEVALLDSDDESDHAIGLQPRYLIPDKVFELYRHFQRHPVLLPSIGRVVSNRIRLFDGQHKIAALLWTNRREFECKIYTKYDIRLLNQTNIAAHDNFAQMRFFSSIMVMKLGNLFGADFEEYKRSEEEPTKSEAAFLKWLERRDAGIAKKADRSEQFRSFLYNSVIEHADNKLKGLISASNRSTDEKPLTIDMLKKSLFACFLYRQPVEENMATEAYKRESEIENMVALMNMMYDLGLHAWNARAPKGDTTQRKLGRMYRSKSMMAWNELLRDAIRARLGLTDSEDASRPFYREMDKQQLEAVKQTVARLFSWKFWSDAGDEIDRVLSDNKSEVKRWLKDHDLTTGYLLGAPA